MTNKTPAPLILIAAAGTGGHVFPGLSLAAALTQTGYRCEWLGTQKGKEGGWVRAAHLVFHPLAFHGYRGKGLWHTLCAPFKLIQACAQAWLKVRKAQVVVAMGGYVTVPVAVAAALARTPLLLINADATWLLSNHSVRRFAKVVLFGLGDAATSPSRSTIKVVGNSLRPEFFNQATPEERYGARRNEPLRILIMGGSLGAQILNQVLPQAFAQWQQAQPTKALEIIHQCGERGGISLQVSQRYAEAGVVAKVVPFIQDVAVQLSKCDVVFCRSGALTISEICAVGVAAVCVPFVARTTAHQVANAQWLAGHHAALHLPQEQLSALSVVQVLTQLDRDRCLQLAQNAYQLRRSDASAAIVAEVQALAAIQSAKKGA